MSAKPACSEVLLENHRCNTAHISGLNLGRLLCDRYTDAKLDFDRYFAECTYVLTPPKYQPGLEFNAVLSNPKDITYILSKNVTAIAVWANIPPSQVYWNAMGSFLTHPIPPTA